MPTAQQRVSAWVQAKRLGAAYQANEYTFASAVHRGFAAIVKIDDPDSRAIGYQRPRPDRLREGRCAALRERFLVHGARFIRRRDHLAGVLEKDAFLVLIKSLADAVRLCNEYAPEHVSVMTEDPASLAKEISTAGAIFLGAYSPVAAGDFVAGPSHTLPTGGGGKSFPGLMADMFQRRTSWVKMDKEALRKSLPIIEAFSALEGLDAHARSAAIRLPTLLRKSKQKAR